MPTYQLITLVDITNPHATRAETDPVRQGQQANFHTLTQTIGLRSNLEWDRDPQRCYGALPPGTDRGKAAWWSWQFFVEREAVFDDGSSPVGLLEVDLHGVPVIAGLTETLDLHPAAFLAKGPNKNIWLTQIL